MRRAELVLGQLQHTTWRIKAALFLLGTAIAMSVGTGALANIWVDCKQGLKAAVAVKACSTLIKSGELPEEQLAEAYYRRGLAYRSLRKYRAAVADQSASIRLKPNWAVPYGARAVTYADLGDYQKAITDHDREIALQPNVKWNHIFKGNTLRKAGKHRQAIKEYSLAIELHRKDYIGEDVLSHFGRAISLKSIGEKERAIADFTTVISSEAINLSPDSYAARSYFSRGELLVSLKKYADAIKDYDQVIFYGRKTAEIYDFRGWAHYLDKNYPAAIEDFTTALRKQPGRSGLRTRRGLAYYGQKTYRLAIAEFDKAIAAEPKQLTALYRRARSYAKLKNYREAVTGYNDLIKLDPQNARAFHSRGIAYEALGDVDQAVSDWEKAIDIIGRARVVWWQKDLKKRGFYNGEVDGVYDKGMREVLVMCARNKSC